MPVVLVGYNRVCATVVCATVVCAQHHSNIVPWQMLAKQTGCAIKYIRLTEDEQLDMEHAKELITPKTKLLSFVHVSNTLG
eukprot:6939155-Pyramimonas_sp.AAC.1